MKYRTFKLGLNNILFKIIIFWSESVFSVEFHFILLGLPCKFYMVFLFLGKMKKLTVDCLPGFLNWFQLWSLTSIMWVTECNVTTVTKTWLTLSHFCSCFSHFVCHKVLMLFIILVSSFEFYRPIFTQFYQFCENWNTGIKGAQRVPSSPIVCIGTWRTRDLSALIMLRWLATLH